MAVTRRPTRVVRVGDRLSIGGDHPIVVQTMTKTDTRDIPATLDEIFRLVQAGCEMVRLAVLDREAALALREIKAASPIPIVADIHFDYRLALLALEADVDKLRLNPGNIGTPDRVRAVVAEAKSRGVPIRIGVNAGSLEKDLIEKYGHPTPEAMVESGLRHLAILDDLNFDQVVVSLKAPEVGLTVEAYRQFARVSDVPLHLGVTEAGTVWSGSIRSAVGLGILLAEGIGDTVRVSLSGPAEEEVKVGREILRAAGRRVFGPTVYACPTCGRCEIDLQKVAAEVERRVQGFTVPLRISVMGCAVNGPGEARESDVGLAGGRGFGFLYKDGKIAGKVSQEEMVDKLVEEVRKLDEEAKTGAERR